MGEGMASLGLGKGKIATLKREESNRETGFASPFMYRALSLHSSIYTCTWA